MIKKIFMFFIFFIVPLSLSSKEVMVNLTKNEALKTHNILKSEKGVLIKKGRSFIYLRTKELSMVKGAYIYGDPSDALYDDSDYHIKIGSHVIDLEFTYIQNKLDKNKWTRLGSKVYPGFYVHRENKEFYVFKGNKPKYNNSLSNAGKIMTFKEDEDDFFFNNKPVFTKLRQVKSI